MQLQLREYRAWKTLRPRVIRAAIKDPANSPVFVFSASWRTGSTLLQRIISASNTIFIWGEPHNLNELLQLYKRMLDVQEQRADGTKQEYARLSWIPVLSPAPEAMRSAFRSFFRELYFTPIEARGYSRWGFKEVHSNAVPAARMLYELFPEAKFIFLVRNPIETYLSIKNMPFLANFADPFDPVNGWKKNVSDFLDVMADGSLPAILVRYEDLIGGEPVARKTIARICSHLGVPFDFPMFRELKAVIGAAKCKEALTPEERDKVLSETLDLAIRMGYELS